MILSTTLCYVYIGLSAMKLIQWGLHRHTCQNGNNKARKQTYTPSLAVIVQILNVFFPAAPLHKVPRSDLRTLTDQWLESYKYNIQNRPPKTFDSLDEAVKDFFCEFCQESSAVFVWYSRVGPVAYINQPLGLCSLLALLLFLLFTPVLVIREVLFCGGSPNSFGCKLAAATTINEIYVVCCKEKSSFEQVLHKYPWASGIFSAPQSHPLIGRAVCPIYKREVLFPTDDRMNFEVKFVNNANGLLKLNQVYSNKLKSCWNSEIFPSHLVLVFAAAIHGLLLSTDFREVLTAITGILPYAASFYSLRAIVDRCLGIKWAEGYYYNFP